MSRVALTGLTKRFGDTCALDGVSLDVEAGELLTVVGPSGSGKTTLLRVIAGLERQDAGTVTVGERDVSAAAPADRSVAFVFQGFALFPHLDVAANIGFGLRARGVTSAEVGARVREAAHRLDLDPLLGRRPAELSGGERQRVALARALAARAAVVLLDEPLSNLDAPLRAHAREQLRRMHAETGATLVHVTHDQTEAMVLGDRVAVLRGGRLEQVGTPDTVYASPATAFVAGFLGSPPMNLLPGRAGGGWAVAGPLRAPAAGDGSVTVGVRPEHLTTDASGFAARIEVVERAGHDELWRVRADGADLWVRPPAGALGRAGEQVHLKAADIRVFGPDGAAA